MLIAAGGLLCPPVYVVYLFSDVFPAAESPCSGSGNYTARTKGLQRKVKSKKRCKI